MCVYAQLCSWASVSVTLKNEGREAIPDYGKTITIVRKIFPNRNHYEIKDEHSMLFQCDLFLLFIFYFYNSDSILQQQQIRHFQRRGRNF